MAPAPLRDWRNWVSLAFRLYLGGMLVVAGLIKLTNLGLFALNISAYRLVPFSVSKPLAYAIAPTEVIVGVLLILGCFTRVAAVIGALLMAAFTFGISWVWAHGYSIDCGCFGSGGATDHPHYLPEIIRDVIAFLGGLWLLVRPISVPSVDRWLFGTPVGRDGLGLSHDDLDERDHDDAEALTSPH